MKPGRFLRGTSLALVCACCWATSADRVWAQDTSERPESELQEGIQSTKAGRFAEAIPHFLAARGNVAAKFAFAVEFNLGICYVGTKQFAEAIRVLKPLAEKNKQNAAVENLLAQALIGNAEKEEGWTAFEMAVKLTPRDEKLYAFVADACAEQREYALGLRLVDLGLVHLPDSARLRYQRGYFLALLDRVDEAKAEFERTIELSPDSEIAAVAETQKYFYLGDPAGTARVARKAVREGRANHIVLTALGESLLRLGAVPGEAEFSEAEGALRRAVEEKQSYPSAQIALGALLLESKYLDEAIAHLEKARELDPRSPRAYAQLGAAYKKRGELKKAEEMFQALAKLNREEAQRISNTPGDSKAIP